VRLRPGGPGRCSLSCATAQAVDRRTSRSGSSTGRARPRRSRPRSSTAAGATFVRGMVRGYAKLLETDPQPLLDDSTSATSLERSTSTCATRASLSCTAQARHPATWLSRSSSSPSCRHTLRVARGSFPLVRFASNTASPAEGIQGAPRRAPAAACGKRRLQRRLRSLRRRLPPQRRSSLGRRRRRRRIRLEFDRESWVEIRDRDGQDPHVGN